MTIDERGNGLFCLLLATLLCSSLTLLIGFCYKVNVPNLNGSVLKLKEMQKLKKEDLQLVTEKIISN